MKRALPTFLTRFLMSVAALMFLIGGATFNHPMAGHDHPGQEHADIVGHHHTDTNQGDIGHADMQTVHCGANLLALTSEFEPIAPIATGELEAIEAGFVFSNSNAIEPPPPRRLS